MSAFLYRLGRACYRLRGRVLVAWLAVLAVFGCLALSLGSTYDDTFSIPGSSSMRALETLGVTFPEAAGASATIVVGAPQGDRIDSAASRRAVEEYAVYLEAELPFVTSVQSPFSEYVDGLISASGSHALVRVMVEGAANTFTDQQREELLAAAQELTRTLPGSSVDVGGDVFAIEMPEITVVEGLGVVVALIVLVLVLGGVLASLMPIGSALTGVGLGVAITMIATNIIAVSSTALILVVMLCLAVGIDYALFIISRHRDQLAHGLTTEESAARAVATGGSAVVFAGGTVMIALVGLSLAGLPFLGIMGAFTAVGVALEVLLALTLLPAFMGFAGERLRPRKRQRDRNRVVSPPASAAAPGTAVISAGKRPLVPPGQAGLGAGTALPGGPGMALLGGVASSGAPVVSPLTEGVDPGVAMPDDSGEALPGGAASGDQQAPSGSAGLPGQRRSPSRWWVRTVTRWPLLTVVIVLVGLGALALPAQGMRMSLPNSGQAAPGQPDRITYDLVTQEFGVGFNGPLVIIGSVVESDDPLAILDGIRADLEAMDGVALVAAAVPNANADTAMIQVIPTTGPDDPATGELVDLLRNQHELWLDEYGIDTAITGLTAVQIDVNERLSAAMLPFGAFVVGLSLILLALAFRSVWVPVKAALGYLLSVGAAFGVVTVVFNEGVGAQLINLPEPVAIISFLPIILMGILFGLAMDYEVFLTSRMREEYIRGNPRWIEDGFAHSAKVVVAAALIMVSVFIFFVPTGIGSIKPIAFGLALGVAFDAFLVRMTLGPAVMKLMGRWAWWLPRWLEQRLPSLDVEGESLAHNTRLAGWPVPDDPAVIHAEGLAAVGGGQDLFHGVSLRLQPGDVLVVNGDRLGRLALMYGLSGRARFSAGEVKVLGRVLPEDASPVRNRTPVVLATTTDLDAELARAAGGIVFAPVVDELPDDQLQTLRAALAAPSDPDHPTTWVLGVAPATAPEAFVAGRYHLLQLPTRLPAVVGASR